MSKVDEFEKAIRIFGVDAALEYFATPKKLYKDFDFLREPPKNVTPPTGGSGVPEKKCFQK